jgi:transcriptional regulator with XRE-family HTH domain
MTITNKQLGDAIGVSESMASRLRSGKRLPSITTIVALSEYLKVSHAELVVAYTGGKERFGELIREALGECSD